jgi:AAA+ superfamily predicted ATPase
MIGFSANINDLELKLAKAAEELNIVEDQIAMLDEATDDAEDDAPGLDELVEKQVTADHSFIVRDWNPYMKIRTDHRLHDPGKNEFERVKEYLNQYEPFKSKPYFAMSNIFSNRLNTWLYNNPDKFLTNSGEYISIMLTLEKTFDVIPVHNMIAKLADGAYFYKYTSKQGGDEGLIFVEDGMKWTQDASNKFFRDFSKELKALDTKNEWSQKNAKAFDRLILDDELITDIRADIDYFLKSRNVYKQELHLPWKRGYMLIGPPGNGKSLLIKCLCRYYGLQHRDVRNAIRNDGSINLNTGMDTKVDMLYYPDEIKPVVYVMEDIDKFVAFQAGERHRDSAAVSLHEVLRAMDGIDEYSDAIVISTTNYPNQLAEALINRPGRFDRIWEIKKPSAANMVKFFDMRSITFTNTTKEEVAADLGEVSMAFVEEFVKSLKMQFKRNEFSKEDIHKVLARIHSHTEYCDKIFGKDGKTIGFGG